MIGRLHLGKLRSLAAEAMHTHFLGKLSALYSRSVPLLLPSGIMYICREEDGREKEGGRRGNGGEVQSSRTHTALGNWR